MKAPSVDLLQVPPTHPGEMLIEEFLRPRQITQVEAARQLRVSTTRLNEIIRGKRGITADSVAPRRLARYRAGRVDEPPEQVGFVAGT